MYYDESNYSIVWVTTHLKEENHRRYSHSFRRTWHCADITNFDYDWVNNDEIYIGIWANPVIVTGKSICGMEWDEEKAVIRPSHFTKASSLCGNCVKKLLNVDTMSAEQLLGYFYDYIQEYYDGEFGRWIHDDEEAVMDALENKVAECVVEVMNS